MTKLIAIAVVNLVTPKVAAKLNLELNKLLSQSGMSEIAIREKKNGMERDRTGWEMVLTRQDWFSRSRSLSFMNCKQEMLILFNFNLFSIMTLSIKGLYATFSISDTAQLTLSKTMICHYAECRVLFIIKLNTIMLNDIMLSVLAPYLLARFHIFTKSTKGVNPPSFSGEFILWIKEFRKWRHDTLHNDTQHNVIQHNVIQHNGIQDNGIQHNGIQHNGIQHNGIQHNDIQHNGIQHNDK
jgi:hypothetical protein